MVGSIDRPLLDICRESTLFRCQSRCEDVIQLPHIRRTRSQTPILAGNAPSRSDYRMATRRRFAATTASASPPLHPSPPPRSVRLVSMIPDLPALPPPLTPVPLKPKLGFLSHGVPVHPAAKDAEVKAAVIHLSDMPLKYSHREWEQAQQINPLCTSSALPLRPPPSHKWPNPAGTLDLTAKGYMLQVDGNTLLLVPNLTVSSPSGRRPFEDPVRFYVPLLTILQIICAYHVDFSCYLGFTRTLEMRQRFYSWIGMEACTKWWVRHCLKCQACKTSNQPFPWPVLPISLPKALVFPSVSTTSGLCRQRPEKNHTFSSSRIV